MEISYSLRSIHVYSGLQWGHERALVEIKEDLDAARKLLELQWGHERALVEIPRAVRTLRTHPLASMGPRARARGNAKSKPGAPRTPPLQWGHERALVEIKSTAWLSAIAARLQWGHERALVEMGN